MNRLKVESVTEDTLYRQMHSRSAQRRSLVGSGLVRGSCASARDIIAGWPLSARQRGERAADCGNLDVCRIVVLDEATASLDSGSEEAVQQALSEALTGRTSIAIAHQLSIVRAADQVLVVADGPIVERGGHNSCRLVADAMPSGTRPR